MKSPYVDDDGNELTPVTSLRVVADTDKTRSETAVILLTDLLEQAQRGQITDMVYITIANGAYEIGRTVSNMDAIAMSNFLNYRFLEQMKRL